MLVLPISVPECQ